MHLVEAFEALIIIDLTSEWWPEPELREILSWLPRPRVDCRCGRGDEAPDQSPSLDTCSHWPPSSALSPPGTRVLLTGGDSCPLLLHSWLSWSCDPCCHDLCPQCRPGDWCWCCGTYHLQCTRTERMVWSAAYTLICIPYNKTLLSLSNVKMRD